MFSFLKRQSPVRIIALGFLATILLGSILLSLPFCLKEGVTLRYIDALYTSTSAVCVTGLVSVDAGSTFTPVGQTILALLIQIGGLGVSTIGAGIILAVGKKFNLKGINVIKEGSNLNSRKGLKYFVRDIFITTIIIEFVGAILSFIVFIKDMDFLTALGVSIFHSIASFNNSGFDILGGINPAFKGQSLIPYQNNVLLNLTTSGLIILGGIGFLVIRDLLNNKFKWKKLSMHTKVVLVMSGALLFLGTLLLKLAEGNDISWLGAFFFSVSARTAGFSTYALNSFSYAGLLVLIILMFIGASPGSTGGGIKTTTFFALLQGIKASATNRSEKAFHYSMPKDAFRKASVITILGIFIVLTATLGISMLEPHLRLIDVLLEATSAFGTVGLSTGITSGLSVGSKLISIVTMYIGRLGPLTIASIWNFTRKETFSYPEGNISIG
ncbi:MAG: H(+)-transporting ATPase [Clostridiales bacterium]|nr:H(+)-transporting ATPase [Clostridiales bacterium]